MGQAPSIEFIQIWRWRGSLRREKLHLAGQVGRGVWKATLVAYLLVCATVPALARIGEVLPRESGTIAPGSGKSGPERRLLLTHYMAWFQAPPYDRAWGWHWTMNHYHPDQSVNAVPEIASHYHPLIGPYASDDPNVLEYHVLLMKLAGIDGVILDWYGPNNLLDYGFIQESAMRLEPILKRCHLHFAVCFEDQSVGKLIQFGRIPASGAVDYGQKTIAWLAQHWFRDPTYVQRNGTPLFLVFGPQFYQDADWPLLFDGLPAPPAFFTLHQRKSTALGAFDWPQPGPGLGLRAVDRFYEDAKMWKAFIPAAFPRFEDIYQQAGVGSSFGSIPDRGGWTYTETLRRAMESKADVIQLVTWNDWGEGTEIEPSVETGFRDLETTQKLRRKFLNRSFRYRPEDLKLPLAWYRRARRPGATAATRRLLGQVARFLERGEVDHARALLRRLR